MSALHLDVAMIEREVANLIVLYPELADDEALRSDVIEGETEAHALLSRIVRAAQLEGAMAAAVKSVAEGLAKRKAAADRREEALRSLAFRIMQAAHLRKVALPEATLSIAAIPQSVQILDEAMIPSRFMRTTYSPLKTEIKDALKSGETIPGVALSNGGERLSVRVS